MKNGECKERQQRMEDVENDNNEWRMCRMTMKHPELELCACVTAFLDVEQQMLST
jgi:hypothetical protein